MGGSSKKQTVGYKYYLGEHMILCHGPIDMVQRIMVDGRVAWQGSNAGGTIQIDKEGLFGGETREGGVSGPVDIEMGGSTQGPNSYLSNLLGPDIPSFRGVVGAVLQRCYLGVNPYLKPWSFRAQRIHVRQDGLPQWYDAKASIGNTFIEPYSFWQYQVVSNVLPPPPIPTGGWSTGQGAFGFSGTGTPEYDINTPWPADTALWIQQTVQTTGTVRVWGRFENALWVYWDGELVAAFNPENINLGVTSFEVYIPPSKSSQSNHILSLYVMDDFESFGGDSTYLHVFVAEGFDMNPAHIVRECLTDPDWGMGYAETDIDDTVFQAVADTLYDEGMGISLLWDRQVPIQDFVDEIIKHIDAALYLDRVSGKFVLKLIRDDYDVGTLPIFSESNIDRIESFNKPTFGELTNSVTVNYWDTNTGETASLTVQDSALINMQGAVINTTVQYPGFTNRTLASRAGLRDLRTLSTPLITCTLLTNQDASGLNIGDAFKLSWEGYQLNEVVMRVTGLAFGDGRKNQIRITAAEDRFATPDQGTLAIPEDGFTELGGPPVAAENRLVLESPYYELVQAASQSGTDDALERTPEIGYVLAAASRPPNAINATLATDSGAGYEELLVLDFCPVAELAAAIDPTLTNVTIQNGSDLDLVEIGSHCQLGEELCRVDAVDEVAGTATIGRGCLDTTPKPHNAGEVIFFWDNYSQNDPSEYVDSEIVNVKILPTTNEGTLDLASAPIDSITLGSRAIRPYPPGQFQLDSMYYPSLIDTNTFDVTWAHRDRTQQTGGAIIDHTAGDIGPETGTSYSLQVYNESGLLDHEITGIVGTVQSVDLSSLPTEFATIKLYSNRDSYESFQPAEHYFQFTDATQFIVFPLTYDEQDYNNEMTWTRQGTSPHVTPDGFEGDGWNSRMTSVTVPSWMAPATKRTLLHGTVSVKSGRLMNSNVYGDVILFLGADAAGDNPRPKMAFTVEQVPVLDYDTYVNFLTHDGSSYRFMALFRREWYFRGRFPELEVGGERVEPQGVCFIDASTVLISAHFDEALSRCYRMNLADWTVTGYFDFDTGTAPHIEAITKDSSGNFWFIGNGKMFEVNLATSFTTNMAVIVTTYDISAAGSSFGTIKTISSVEYVMVGEYVLTGTRYLYVFPLSQVVDSGTFDIANRTIRYLLNERTHGIVHDGTDLYLSLNRTTAQGSGVRGYIHKIAIDPTGDTDGDSIEVPDAQYIGPAQYPNDVDFHPVTGELWCITYGWDVIGDEDGFQSLFSSALDYSSAVQPVSAVYDGVGTFTVRINNLDFQSENWIPAQEVEAVSVGGPPNATEEFNNGFFLGFVKNVRIQNKDFGGTEYDDTVDGSIYEPNSLTVFNLTLTNPGAEAGDGTGWTNETGSAGVKDELPTPFEGSYFFTGGNNSSTKFSQRSDLITETGLTGPQLDAGGIWAKARWAQASYSSTDPCTMGIRMLDAVPAEISVDYGWKDWVAHGNSGATPNWRQLAIGVDIPVGGRFTDVIYNGSRTSGTVLDGYVDSITMTVYQQ